MFTASFYIETKKKFQKVFIPIYINKDFKNIKSNLTL